MYSISLGKDFVVWYTREADARRVLSDLERLYPDSCFRLDRQEGPLVDGTFQKVLEKLEEKLEG